MGFFGRVARAWVDRTSPPLPAGGRGADDPAAAIAPLLERAVFVAGRGRSGSSLLLRLFDGHPEVFAIPLESRLLTEVAPKLRKTGDHKDAIAEMSSRFAKVRRDGRQVRAEALIRQGVAALDPASPNLSRDLIRIALEAVACERDPAGAACFLEKTPKNEEHLAEIFRLFPEGRVIYLVRDPRAVYLSNKRSELFRMSPAFAAKQWVKSVNHVLRYTSAMGAQGKVLVVRYEDVVANSRATLQTLCGFIGVGVSEALDRPTVHGRPWQGNSYAAGAEANHEIDAAKAHSWRGEIKPSENAAIVGAAQFEMSLLGYPPE